MQAIQLMGSATAASVKARGRDLASISQSLINQRRLYMTSLNLTNRRLLRSHVMVMARA